MFSRVAGLSARLKAGREVVPRGVDSVREPEGTRVDREKDDVDRRLVRDEDDGLARDDLFLRLFGAGGTFAPFLRASESPMATACLGFLTVFPVRPLLSLPLFILCIASLTDFCDVFPYRAMAIPPCTVRHSGA